MYVSMFVCVCVYVCVCVCVCANAVAQARLMSVYKFYGKKGTFGSDFLGCFRPISLQPQRITRLPIYQQQTRY